MYRKRIPLDGVCGIVYSGYWTGHIHTSHSIRKIGILESGVVLLYGILVDTPIEGYPIVNYTLPTF